MSADAPSPVAPLAQRVGLALLAATVVARTLTCGAGLELDLPGSQLLLDALALCAAACVAIGRAFEGAPVLAAGRSLLGASLAALVVLALSAARAPHAELAWRSAITHASFVVLALAVRDLARDPRRARGLLALAAGCVLAGATLALWQELVEQPALRAELEAGRVALPDDPGFRQQMLERIHSRGSAGPFLLTNLLACAIGMLAPALLVAGLQPQVRRRPLALAAVGAGLLLLLAALLQARSKGGTLAALAGVGALALLHPRLDAHRRRLTLAGAAAGGLLLAVGLAWWALHPEAEGVGLSLQVRLEYWRAGLGMFASSPLLGVGFNQFRCFYPAFKSLRAEEVAHAHNGAVEVAAEAGLLGLVAVGALAALWLRAGVGAATTARDEEPAERPGGADDLALGAGALLGLLLAGAYGDAYTVAETPGALVAALGMIGGALWTAGWLPRPPARALAAAAVAGLAAFAADGLTDFGLAFANTAMLAALLAGLAPGLGEVPAGADGLRGRAGAALAGALSLAAVLALGVALSLGHPADAARREARDAHEAAAAAQGEGQRRLLEEALDGFRASSAAWPWHARTWLEQASVEQSLGRRAAARASLERALALEPRSGQTRRELAELLAAEGDLAGARRALDEAVALYPGQPGHLLAAARVRLAGTPTAADRADALALLRRALEASATIRQQSVKLSAADRAQAERLVAELSAP